MTVAAILLAAGGGSRWLGPGHKLVARLADSTVVETAMSHVPQCEFDEFVVVDGAIELTQMCPAGTTVLHNPNWASGQGSSLGLALDHARDRGHTILVVGLGDQPGIATESWRAVRDARSPIAVATYDGRRGHPVRLAREVWDLLDLSGDRGAGPLMRGRPDLVTEVPCFGDPRDIDTVGDLRRWTS
jgi:CTP:molybdopterin cytidylyltransferase MocA